ncbi:hypothetical protein OH76DRAFT_1491105 [Lentinus brumalis]|uniref:Uncharacterized protein n=1 Tax=Lentinus brumalis TaxID=2498619 RepID=A0A371CGT2_9APHY|nr:hypothetical protein OH76DRAFT_1491105 [Polyporus brumalis]
MSSSPTTAQTRPAVYTFARWDRRDAATLGLRARPQDLKYYLRVAHRGNGLTIPLPMRPPEGRTLAHLQAIVAFMDSHECSQMELPLKVWRLTRDFAMTFHAFWSDGRTEVSATRQEICALLMHTTPYRRLPLIPNATEELTDVMAYAKTSMPWDVFRAPYVSPRAAWLAADTITADCTFATRGVCVRFTLDGDLEEQAGDVPAGEASVPVGIDDRPGSPLHTTRDARECCDITIVIGSLPKLPPGILAHISLPSTSL